MVADCPYCRQSALALKEFHDAFASKGLVVIGMYTPKPRPRAVSADEVRGDVKAYGFTFTVASDEDWGASHKLWLHRVQEARAPPRLFSSIDRESCVTSRRAVPTPRTRPIRKPARTTRS